jgi:hypothetical protein
MDSTATIKITKADFPRIMEEAISAGLKAGEEVIPVPMHVVQRANPLDDNSPIIQRYEPIMDGVCGFAWVNVKPGTSSFARWLSKNGLGHKSYYGGVDIWISDHSQSMTRKECHARAFAEVLRGYGIEAHSMSRID